MHGWALVYIIVAAIMHHRCKQTEQLVPTVLCI